MEKDDTDTLRNRFSNCFEFMLETIKLNFLFYFCEIFKIQIIKKLPLVTKYNR